MRAPTDIGTVILAGGSSSRLGRPKQLLQFQGKTLLQRLVDMVIPFNFTPAVLVLGAYADQIREATNMTPVTPAYNEKWSEGIASSIRLGVEESLKLNPTLESILFLLADQPFVSPELIRELIHKHMSGGQSITACRYKQNRGVPAVFRKDFFPKLQELTGDAGAQKMIAGNSEEVEVVSFKRGYFDIDTDEDYERLQDNVI